MRLFIRTIRVAAGARGGRRSAGNRGCMLTLLLSRVYVAPLLFSSRLPQKLR